MKNNSQKQIALWLLVCCALIFVMVVLGGVTRLTRSGLSIVEWDPVMGAIPPLNTSQWEETFTKYKQTPEYQKINVGMSINEFKSIFWFEYAHRLLGRGIGLAFLLPFLYFLGRKKIDKAMVPKLITMFVLGGLQGLLGWYMVKSGLVKDPHVSAYRLTAHLGFAIIIYAYMFWVALGLLTQNKATAYQAQPLRRFGIVVTTIIFLMILSGGLVAGNKAGFAFNTFPLMNGYWFPPGMYALEPVWINWFENIATVQFNHRMLAYILVVVIFIYWLRARGFSHSPRIQLGFHALLAVLIAQVMLGITTLLYIVPIPLAAAHQGGALVVLSVSLFLNHGLRKSPMPRPAEDKPV